MKRTIFTDSWCQVFAEFGLRSFGDFFDHSAIEVIGSNEKRSVGKFTLGSDSQQKQFFIKRFFRPHLKDVFFAWRNLGKFCSQAQYEYENAGLLLDNGIGTYRPVCFGENTKWGIENKSFIITEKLEGLVMTDFVRQHWHNLDRHEKEKAVADLAVFIRSIHNLNISLPDLYLWHIFINKNSDGGYDFAVIDLHRMSRNVNINTQIKNLGRLDYSMLDKYFDEDMRHLFVKAYAGHDRPGDIVSLARKVKMFSKAISSKRRRQEY